MKSVMRDTRKLKRGNLAKDFNICYYARMLTKKKKQNIIKKNQVHDKDTGSPEVQIAMLSERIDELASHLKTHKKDNHSRRGLLKMVADRRTHLKYIEKTDKVLHAELIKKADK